MDIAGNGVKYLNYDSTSLEHNWVEDDDGYKDLCFVASAPGDYQVTITDWFGCTDTCIIHVQ